MKERVAAAGYAVAWSTVRRTPEWLPRNAFRMIADVLTRRGGRTAEQLAKNLSRVVGPGVDEATLAGLVHDGMRSYLRYWMEVFRLPAIAGEVFVRDMHMDGADRLQAAYRDQRGVVLALPHMGNWDAAGAWSVQLGMPFTTVAERLRPESLFDRFVAFRESLGMEVLPLTGGASPYPTLRARLEAGGLLCLLADRDLTVSGVPVQFFGEPARMPAGPAALSLDTDAVLLPVTLWYPEDGEPGWRGCIHEPVEPPTTGDRRERIAAMTQSMADVFGAGIAKHPADWHMVQRLWEADLKPHESARLTTATGTTT
ncbi:MAG: phosphatidylinositol mannoside acyltransferase [Actinomycetes bacterium]